MTTAKSGDKAGLWLLLPFHGLWDLPISAAEYLISDSTFALIQSCGFFCPSAAIAPCLISLRAAWETSMRWWCMKLHLPSLTCPTALPRSWLQLSRVSGVLTAMAREWWASSGDTCWLPQETRTLCSFRLVMLLYPLLLYAAAESLWCVWIALFL